MTKSKYFDAVPRSGWSILAFMAALIGFLVLMAVVPGALKAQDVDSRWLPWMGCWEVVGAAAGQEVVCVEPHQDELAVTLDYASDQIEDLVFRADGNAAQVSQAGCQGEERASFSPDGRRIYITASYVCDGGTEQTGTGLLAMVSDDEWVEIRSLSVEGESVAWVQRYVQATPAAVQAAGERDLVTPDILLARRFASRAPSLNTLAEVARGVDAKVASAWIVESGYPFEVTGEQLVALADAGVDAEVLDVLVAVSNPRHFNIAPGGDPSRQDGVARPRGVVSSFGYTPYFGRRYGRASFGFYYSPWGYLYSPYGYDPFGYNPYYGYSPYYGYGYGYGGYRPAYVVVRSGGAEDPGGRAVAGQGYTRSRGSSASSASQGYRAPRSNGAVRRGSPPRSAPPSASSGGSSGGTRTAKPRTAKPRGGGGGV